MKKATTYILTSILICLTSCEGIKYINVTVVSANTGSPIRDAEINVLNGIGDSTRTDSSGQFIIRTGFTGMMFGGPKFKFEVKKDGYETQVIKSKFPSDTIRLITN